MTEPARGSKHTEIRLELLACGIAHSKARHPIRLPRNLLAQEIQICRYAVCPARKMPRRKRPNHPISPIISPGRRTRWETELSQAVRTGHPWRKTFETEPTRMRALGTAQRHAQFQDT